MIFVLQQIWPSIKSKISNHIDQVSTTQLGNEKSLLLKTVLDDLKEKCVNKIIQFQWPSEKKFFRVFIDNLFSSIELLTICQIYNMAGDKFREKQTHKGTQNRYNAYVNMGNFEITT